MVLFLSQMSVANRAAFITKHDKIRPFLCMCYIMVGVVVDYLMLVMRHVFQTAMPFFVGNHVTCNVTQLRF